MKRILSITAIFSLTLFLLSSFSLRENPQDPPRGKKSEKHIKLISVGDDGKKMELDTVIEGENVFVWNGDTIGGEKELKWVSEGDFDFDMDMDIDVQEMGDGKVIIMKSGKGGAPMIQEFKMDGDSNKIVRVRVQKDGMENDHDVMMWNSKEGNKMLFHSPQMGGMEPHKMIRIEKGNKGNVIDLSDPGIISYDKKELKDGKEKITIIRNKPVEKDIELHEEIIMQGAGNQQMLFHGDHAKQSKTVKVIKDDNGNITIFEDGKERKIKAGEGENAFISEDGNVYHIKTTKEGDKEKMEVKVEVEEVKKEKK